MGGVESRAGEALEIGLALARSPLVEGFFLYEIPALTGVSQIDYRASLMIDRILDCTYPILCLLILGGMT